MIYVDALKPALVSRKWPYKNSCHLFTDPGNEHNLHDFAMVIGLKWGWFQDNHPMPHYDLTSSKRRLAVQQGARQLSNHETLEVLNRWRDTRL